MDVATIEYSRRPTENKIDRTLNITVLIILATVFTISVKRILKTQKAAILEKSTICRHKTSYCLPHRTGSILKSYILGIKIRCINITGRRTGSPLRFSEDILFISIIVIRKNRSFLTYQRNIYFTFRYHDFFFVDTFTDKNSSTHIFTKIGYGTNGILNSKKVTATILCYHIIIVTNVFSQFGNSLCNGIHCQTGHYPATIYIKMCIIFTPFRKGRYFVRLYPHEKFLRFYRS